MFNVTPISIHTGIESNSKVFNNPMTHVFGDGRDELGHFTFQILNCLRIVSVHIVFCISPQKELKCLCPHNRLGCYVNHSE